MVTSSYPKYPGDVTAPFVEAIARGVLVRGHRVDLVLPYHPELRCGGGERLRFFPYRYAPADAWSLWGYAQSLQADVRVRRSVYALVPLVALALRRAISARLCAERYDVVHAHWVVPNAALIADLARAHRVSLVVSLHGSDVFLAERFAPAGWLARSALSRAGAVTACSADLAERALRLGALRERTRTVPYGVDLELFAPRPEAQRRAARAQLGVAQETLFVLALGRLVEKKGFADLVVAAARTRGVRVVIAGEGDLRASLEEQARALRAPVSFAGKLDRGAVAETLAAADAVVVPSVVDRAGNVDGLPNVLLEAMACGRAVVATRVAGIPDVVRDGADGLLVPPGDPLALALALARLLTDVALRVQLGSEARRSAERRLSWPAAARAFEEAYVQAAALDAG